MLELSKSPAGKLYGPTAGPKVVLYNREPIFEAISLLKKKKLFADRKKGVISRSDCLNVNQRGGPSCKAAMGENLDVSFEDLDETVEIIEDHVRTARKLAVEAARRFKTSVQVGKSDPNFLEFSYSELVCAQSRRGAGFLPDHVARFIGFGSECPTEPKETTAIKASPANPATSLSDLTGVYRRARSARREWAKALERPVEAWPCNESHTPKGKYLDREGANQTFPTASHALPPLPPPVEAPPVLPNFEETFSLLPATILDIASPFQGTVNKPVRGSGANDESAVNLLNKTDSVKQARPPNRSGPQLKASPNRIVRSSSKTLRSTSSNNFTGPARETSV
jgi:hypothetical protein